MMPPNFEQRRPAITPQLAVRVAVLGGIALVAFSIVFFRLWFLQVLTGEEYVSQARENRVRKVRIEAPRGDIVDRNERPLVQTREAPVVQIVPSALPEAAREAAAKYSMARSKAERKRLEAEDLLEDFDQQHRPTARRASPRKESAGERRDRKLEQRAVRQRREKLKKAAVQAQPVAIPPVPSDQKLRSLYSRLSKAIGLPVTRIHERVTEGIADAPYANVTLKTDISREQYNFLYERREQFPGVEPTSLYLRDYPHETIAAHLFGTIGEISPEEQKLERYRDVAAGTRVGKDGIEESYDDYLRGTPGYDKVVIDAFGDRDERRRVTRREPRQGNRLRLTLDLELEKTANDAIQRAISAAAVNGAKAGAYVAMNPENGEVYALGSYPSFDANLFAKPLSESTYRALTSKANGEPLLNRAISATYSSGSTFKPITALAALEEGIIEPGTVINDTGAFRLGNQTRYNAKKARFGPVALSSAMKVSSDVFFYQLGAWANDDGAIIQQWARQLGLGRTTGIDLPGEFPGLIPDRRWRDDGYRKYRACAKKAGAAIGSTEALYACGGIERPWSVGDNVSLAIGQGDVQTTPLQMAVAYAAIGNGGRVVLPHLGMKVENGAGQIVEELPDRSRRNVAFADEHRSVILDGLRRAAMEPGGTSAHIFGAFAAEGLTIYGKTGTVETGPGRPDQAWYAAYVPHSTRPMVVVVTVESGGFGAETAAPVACSMVAKWFRKSQQLCRAPVVTG